MKLMYGNVPVKSLNIHTYEQDTNSATVQASDMQAGVTAFARGQKIVGTGKCFSFAMYGVFETNASIYVPNNINVVEIASTEHPIKSLISFQNINTIDFSAEQAVGVIDINGLNIEIKAKVENNILTFICSNTINLEIFFGKDDYLW